MTNQKDTAVNIFIASLMGNSIMMVVARVAGILFTVVGARLLGVEQLGILLIVLGYVTLLSAITGVGLPAGLPHFVTDAKIKTDHIKISELLQTSILVILATSSLTAFVSYQCANYLSTEVYEYDTSAYLKIASLTVPLLAVVKVVTGVLLGLGNTVVAAFIELTLLRILYLSIVIVAYLLQFDLTSILASIVIALFIRLIVALISVKQYLGSFAINFEPLISSKFLTYVSNTWITSVTMILRTRGDIILVGALLTPAKAALFGVGLSLASFLLMTSKIVSPAYRPVATKLIITNELEELKRYYRNIVAIDLSIVIPVVVFLVLFSGQLIQSVFGIEYAGASIVFILVSVGYVLSAAFGPVNSTLLAFGATSEIRNIDITTSILFLLLFSALTYSFGLSGSSVSVSITWVLQNYAKFIAVKKYIDIGIEIPPKLLGYMIFMTLSAYLLKLAFNSVNGGLIQLFLLFLIHLCFALFVSMLLKIISAQELKTNLFFIYKKINHKLFN